VNVTLGDRCARSLKPVLRANDVQVVRHIASHLTSQAQRRISFLSLCGRRCCWLRARTGWCGKWHGEGDRDNVVLVVHPWRASLRWGGQRASQPAKEDRSDCCKQHELGCPCCFHAFKMSHPQSGARRPRRCGALVRRRQSSPSYTWGICPSSTSSAAKQSSLRMTGKPTRDACKQTSRCRKLP